MDKEKVNELEHEEEVTDFFNYDDMEYKFVTREYKIQQTVGGNIYEQECIGIAIHDSKKGIDYPSPMTNFIKDVYRRKNDSLSNQRNPANYICKFLNFCRKRKIYGDNDYVELNKNGFFGLKRKHASIFITELSILSRAKKLSPQYVRDIIRKLNHFYEWLSNQGILQEDVRLVYSERNRKMGNRVVKEVILKDIFDTLELGTVYPPRRKKEAQKLVDFGKNRYEVVDDFLNLAEHIAPEIYLGCCFQFFGGLRQGEVVNLTRKSLIKLEEGYMLDIEDNREVLFPKKKSTKAEQVKVPREQALFWNHHLERAMQVNQNLYNSMKEKGNLPIPEALFINPNAKGASLTGTAYRERFNEVKEELFEKLSKEGKSKMFNFLNSKPWSTHLARGVFTNFCLDMGMSISETAIARGDANISSVMAYVEKLAAYESMTDAMNKIRNAFDKNTGKMKSTIPTKASKSFLKEARDIE